MTTDVDSERHGWPGVGVSKRRQPKHCGWCGRGLPVPEGDKPAGRRRQYCGQACRQRAYERRTAAQRTGIPQDAVMLAAAEVADLQDRLFALRCAAEDIATAIDDGAAATELAELARDLVKSAKEMEKLR